MDLSAHDRDLLIKTVMAEAGPKGDPDEQAAVAHVILNRLNSGNYRPNLPGVLFQRGQFEPWDSSKLNDPKNKNNPLKYNARTPGYDDTARVVDGVLSGQTPDPTGGSDHFQQPDIVNARIKAGQIAASSAAPQGAQRIGNQVFWKGGAPKSKPNPKDYADLFEEPAAQPTKTAGDAALGAAKPKAENYADLFEDTGTEPAKAAPAPPPDESGLFGALPRQVREHPYIAGGLAALAVPAVAAVGAEVGIPALIGAGGAALGRMLSNRAVQYGVGTALGTHPDIVTSPLHSLARLIG